MLVDAMMLHPHTSMQRGGGCGMRLFCAANNMASRMVFVSFKSRQRDASHALSQPASLLGYFYVCIGGSRILQQDFGLPLFG